MGSVNSRAQVDAVGNTFDGLNLKANELSNPTDSAPVVKGRTVGRLYIISSGGIENSWIAINVHDLHIIFESIPWPLQLSHWYNKSMNNMYVASSFTRSLDPFGEK